MGSIARKRISNMRFHWSKCSPSPGHFEQHCQRHDGCDAFTTNSDSSDSYSTESDSSYHGLDCNHQYERVKCNKYDPCAAHTSASKRSCKWRFVCETRGSFHCRNCCCFARFSCCLRCNLMWHWPF